MLDVQVPRLITGGYLSSLKVRCSIYVFFDGFIHLRGFGRQEVLGRNKKTPYEQAINQQNLGKKWSFSKKY